MGARSGEWYVLEDMGYQTLTLEYRVAGNLDGETLAEPFAPVSVEDSEQIFNFNPAALGLIDLTGYGFTSQRANRFVHWIHLVNFTADVGDVNVAVARFRDPLDQSSEILDVEDFMVQTNPATNIRYSKRIICVPQGYLLRLRTNGRALLTDDTIVRMGVYVPETQEEDVLIRRARCCTAGFTDGEFELPGDEPTCPLQGAIDPDIFGIGNGLQNAQVTINTIALGTDTLTLVDFLGNPVGITVNTIVGNAYNVSIQTNDPVVQGQGTLTISRDGCDPVLVPVTFIGPG